MSRPNQIRVMHASGLGALAQARAFCIGPEQNLVSWPSIGSAYNCMKDDMWEGRARRR